MSAPGCPSLSVVLFAYNEAENIDPVLSELGEWLATNVPDAEVIFVDDGSTDETAKVAAAALGSRGRVISHSTNRGIGAGLKSGVRAARGEWVTFLPADGQIAPEAIGTLLSARGDEHRVVFSVYEDRDDGLHRKVLSWGVRALIRGVHGVNVESDGPYLFERVLFDPDQLEPDSFFLNFEFPIRVRRAGVPSTVVTISCRPRLAGVSKSANLSRVFTVGRDLVELRLRSARAAMQRARGR